MAYKDSDELKDNERYPLGDYSFRIERSSVPGSTNDKIEAVCTQGGKNARKSIQVPSSTQLLGWYVEANTTEASVYVILHSDTIEIDTGNIQQPIPTASSLSVSRGKYGQGRGPWYTETFSGNAVFWGSCNITGGDSTSYRDIVMASSKNATITEHYINHAAGTEGYLTHSLDLTFTYAGKTVYYEYQVYSPPDYIYDASGFVSPFIIPNKIKELAWAMVYESGEPEDQEKLVARFAIEIKDAGGVGPGSDWDDPGDYDPDWEEGDPTHTLYVTVTGALSGRHNDPIVDPSYSYIPADKDTVKDYGCGGDGGHGGGGGAGASTVIVHKFATNQANSKEITAIARRHGYGSGGGKGGKGGDGCILVYY